MSSSTSAAAGGGAQRPAAGRETAGAGLAPEAVEGPWLVVGLGNPGPEHAADRHTVGAMVVDELASRLRTGFKASKQRAAVAEVRHGPPGAGSRRVGAGQADVLDERVRGPHGGPRALLRRRPAARHRRARRARHRRRGGAPQARRAARAATTACATSARRWAPRTTCACASAIGRPPGRMDPADFVLRGFSSAERKELPFLLSDAADAVEAVITDGLEAAQQRFHGPR